MHAAPPRPKPRASYAPLVGAALLTGALTQIILSASADDAQRGGRGVPLEMGKPIEREIRGGETHVYEVALPQGKVILGAVDQRGVDVVLRVINPSGRTVATLDSPNGPQGPEPWILEPKPAGAWRIEVAPFEPKAAGRYEVRIDEAITAFEHGERRAKLRYRSPRMLALWREHNADGAAAIERFAKEMTGRAPLVEPAPSDPNGGALITFLWMGEPDTHDVALRGGPKLAGFETPMHRFEETSLWYLTARVPRDLRVTYAFRQGPPPDLPSPTQVEAAMDMQSKPDPWNPRQSLGRSLVELPAAPAQPWAERKEGVAPGRVVEASIKSEILTEDRKLGVYLPAAFDPAGGPYPFVIVFDGEMYGLLPESPIPTPTILDNLIAQSKAPPMLGVLVRSQTTRSRDLGLSAPFCDFLVKELVPWLRKEYRASESPAEATLAGSSAGGLASAYCAFHHPNIFGNALSQSGAFWFSPGAFEAETPYSMEPGALIREILGAPARPVRLWMEVGIYEAGIGMPLGQSLIAQNRHMRDVLLAKGYDVSYREYAGGHDYASWRGGLADGLIALAGKPKTK